MLNMSGSALPHKIYHALILSAKSSLQTENFEQEIEDSMKTP